MKAFRHKAMKAFRHTPVKAAKFEFFFFNSYKNGLKLTNKPQFSADFVIRVSAEQVSKKVLNVDRK